MDGFDFSKLPKEEHDVAIRLVSENDLRGLFYLHNKYKLSEYDYSCCGLHSLLDWFRHGIEHGQITSD